MLGSLDSGVSALQQFQQALDVIGNNIANVSTVGYKAATVDFADAFSETLGANSAGTMQVGTGVLTSAIVNQFTQGTPTSTGNNTDMAINGNGFFLVKDPSSGGLYATRDGQFSVDANGYLVTANGLRVQGYTSITNGVGSNLGDIKVDNTGATTTDSTGATVPDTSAVSSYTFGSDGTLKVTLSDGVSFSRGQILLQQFTSPNQLLKQGNNLYSNLSQAGPLAAPVAPSTTGPGTLSTGYLEMSNVDLAGQMAALITTQRAFEASAKIITTSDEVMQDLVNLKR